MKRRGTVLLTTIALVVAACSSGSGDSATTSPDTDAPATDAPTTEPAPAVTDPVDSIAILDLASLPPLLGADFNPGVEQLAVVGADPDLELELVRFSLLDDAANSSPELESIAAGTADAYGSLLFRGLAAGDLYFVESADSRDGPFTVLGRDDHPDAAFYSEQRLPAPGFGYIEMRDGTTLSANIVLPGPVEDGPYPTVVEYSGYTPSDPEGTGFKDLFTPLGYAYVGVNMRGTGCSGGSFRFFEYAQSIDGYDIIEAVAAQPWVFDNRVGMVGVSYPGISQLFVAQTQPPSLAAITPFSVLDDSSTSTLYPGGILNTGFALEWTQDRIDNGMPAVDPNGTILDEGGQGWAKDQIEAGDETCGANQSLRLQNPDLVHEIRDTPFYEASVGDEISPRLFVDKITVPTFIAGAWQDEQTGGRFATMLDLFTGTDHLYASMMNGLHTESIGPANFPRWVEFLDLYVAKRTPTLDTARIIAPILAGGIFGTTELELPADRFTGMTYDEALAAFESEPPIRILFEEGAADGVPALTPLPRFVEEFDSWPISGDQWARSWFLAGDGRLVESVDELDPIAFPSTSYLALPDGIPPTFWDGNSSDLWRTDVEWDWLEPARGTVAPFLSAPLEETLVMIGSGSADLWISSNLPDTDLEVTLTEVRPDGNEVYVQSGWLRASHRALAEGSTDLRPVHSHLEADAAPLPETGAAANTTDADGDGPFSLARVEIFPFAHVFRTGSQIRLSVDAPGGNRAVWVFETIANGEQVTIELGGSSRVVLPVVPGIDVPPTYPDCNSLRGQPCRVYTG